MGITLPLLCRVFITQLPSISRQAGWLYGLNTLGGALGVLWCGFHLIQEAGVNGSLVIAAVMNGVIGVTCLAATKALRKRGGKEHSWWDPAQPSGPSRPEPFGAITLLFIGTCGFCAIGYEVVLTRLLTLVMGPTVYAFTTVLFCFIAGLALGSAVFGWLGGKTGLGHWLLPLSQVSAGILFLTAGQIIGDSQLFFTKLNFHWQEDFGTLHAARTGLLFAFLLAPTLCLGALFPLISQFVTRSFSSVGQSIGKVYSLSTLGNVLGALFAGLILLPLTGKELSLKLLAGVHMAAALIFLLRTVVHSRRLLTLTVSVAAAILGAASLIAFPHWNRDILSKANSYSRIGPVTGNLKWSEVFRHAPDILLQLRGEKMLYYADGAGGSVSVWEMTDILGNRNRTFYMDGKADASSREDMATQALLAHVPMVTHSNPGKVMILGLASGVTAGEVLHYPVTQLDVLEISTQAVEACKFFESWNNDVLDNPVTNLIIQDAKSHLILTENSYDVIISEPSNPWMSGIPELFTREFFMAARQRLQDTGVFAQFIPSFKIDWETFSLIGRTFTEVFPQAVLLRTNPNWEKYSGNSSDYILLGFKQGKRTDFHKYQDKLQFLQRSKNIHIQDMRIFYPLMEADDAKALFRSGDIHTEDRPLLDYAAERAASRPPNNSIASALTGLQNTNQQTRDFRKRFTFDADFQLAYTEFALSVFKPFSKMADTSIMDSLQRARLFALTEQYCKETSVEDIMDFPTASLQQHCADHQTQALLKRLEVDSRTPEIYAALAALAEKTNKPGYAVQYYGQVIQQRNAPSELIRKAYFERARLFYSLGRINQARAELRRARSIPTWYK
jgi:spermidine synthase